MHIFEYAKSGRSSCKGPKKTCPVTDRSIRQGELRLGVEVETPRSLLFWRHWCCTTPKVIENLHAAYSEPSEISGWDTLREDDQERIQRAWDLGRIPDNELPQPAAEHIDPKKKKQGNVDLPPTNVIAAEKQTKTKNKGGNKTSMKEEENKETVGVKDEHRNVEMEIKGAKQDTVIKKPKKAPEEPKVASYASRKAKPQTASKEPTRKSSRVAAYKKDEPAQKRKINSTESKAKKAKAV